MAPDAASARAVAAWAAVAAGASAALLLGFAPSDAQRTAWFLELGPRIVLADLALVAGAGAWLLRDALRDRGIGPDALVAGTASAVIVAALVLASPSVMRVQADEYQIAGVAFGLWNGLGPLVPVGWFAPGGGVELTWAGPDKRPLLVPMLIAGLHFVRGYDFDHGFWVNAAAGWIALVALYRLAREWVAPAPALAACLLLAAMPAFAWAMTSQGLEAVNLALVLGSAALLAAAVRRDAPSLACLAALAGPLLAQARHESAAFALLSWPLAAWLVARRGAPKASSIAMLALAPLLYLPVAWQRATPFDFEGAATPYAQLFAFDNFTAHAGVLVRMLALPDAFNPTGPVAASLAVLGLATGVARAGRATVAQRVIAAWFALAAGLLAFVLAYAWGDLSKGETHRLGLVAFAGIALAAACGLERLRFGSRHAWGLVVAGACAAVTARTLPADALGDRLLSGPAMRAAESAIAHAFPRCRLLVVTPNAPYYLLRGRDSVTAAPLQFGWPDVRARLAVLGFDGIVAVQVHNTRDGRLQDGAHLPTAFSAREILAGRVDDDSAWRVLSLDHPSDPLPSAPRAAACGFAPYSAQAAPRPAPGTPSS